MKGIVISGHGEFAQGLFSLVQGILGHTEQLAIAPYDFEKGAEELKSDLIVCANRVDSGEGVIFCTDILGGTPFNKSSEIAIVNPGYHVIAGCNFTTLHAAISLREDDGDDESLIQAIIQQGKDGITSLAEQLVRINVNENDGI